MRVAVAGDEARTGGGAPERLARRGAEVGDRLGRGPALSVATVALAGYAVVAATLVVAGMVVTDVLPGTIGVGDSDAVTWFADHRVGWADASSAVVSRSADTLGIVGLAALVVAFLGRRRCWWQVRVLVLALSLELFVFLLVNWLVDRPRPDVERLGSTPSTSSFPSGHSAAAVVLYGCVALFVWLATTRRAPRLLAVGGAVVAPLAVATARVYRGMHHPADVVFGLSMGAAVTVVAVLAVCAGYGGPTEGSQDERTSALEGRPARFGGSR